MKLHETRLQRDFSAIQEDVGRLAEGVREAIDEAVHGLLTRDRQRMYNVMLNDHPYNRQTRALDAACHAFVARHLPAAGYLRWVSSVLRLTIGLERIGDYAVTICRVGVHLETDLPQSIQDDIRALADQSSRMLELATRAFLKSDAELARDTAKMAKRVDRTHDRVFHAMVESEALPRMDVIRLQTIYDKLERVSDQAKNLCEEAVFVTTGETKQPKVYRVLFLDQDGAFLAPLAEALARRTFPNSGAYRSQGLEPADAFAPSLLALQDDLALDLGGPGPSPLEPFLPHPDNFHVIVSLNLPADQVPEIPFTSIHLAWSLDVPAGDAPKAPLVHALQDQIANVMQTLRGEGAD